MVKDFYSDARDGEADVIAWRRRFHENPEIAFQEHETAAFVAERLREFGYAPTFVGKTGVLAILEGGRGPGMTLGLRADMDALPGEEKTNLPFASKKPGAMHSCGHDVHTAVLLGVARVLIRHKNDLPGRVKFFFQPAEEALGGAKTFVQAGVLDDVDGLAALHVMTDIETGHIALRRGVALAASDRFTITVTGRACHGAQPQRGTDAIVVAAQVVTALQTLVARTVAPLDSVVVTIGTITGGFAANIVPASVTLEGTLRSLSAETRKTVLERMGAIAEHTAKAFGAEAVLHVDEGTPPLYCDEAWVDRMARVAGTLLPEGHVHFLPEPSMGGEDFAFMLQKAPGVFWRLGARAAGTEKTNTHSATFVADEAAMVHGVALTCALAADALEGGTRE